MFEISMRRCAYVNAARPIPILPLLMQHKLQPNCHCTVVRMLLITHLNIILKSISAWIDLMPGACLASIEILYSALND